MAEIGPVTYPPIQQPTQTLEGLQKTSEQLKEAVELLTGQRGPAEYSIPLGLYQLRREVISPDGHVAAMITQMNEVVATANEALAQQVTILEAEIVDARQGFPSLSAKITNTDTARVNGDTALAVRATNLEVEVTNARGASPNLSAKITSVDQARIDGDTAVASSVTTLSTTVGTNSANISTLFSSTNGMALKFGVTGYINGVTGGFVFTGALRNDGAVVYNMEFYSNVIIHGSLTVDGTIDTPKVVANAISRANSNTGSGAAVSVSLTCRAGSEILLVATMDGSGTDIVAWTTQSDRVRIQNVTTGAYLNSVPVAYFRDIASGGAQWFLLSTTLQASYTAAQDRSYTFRVVSETGLAYGGSIFALEMAR